MTYKIYPTTDDKWLKIWKKIKQVARQTGMQIAMVDCNDRLDSIITLSQQTELFDYYCSKINTPKRDRFGRFAK